ncbi:hypothetical protein [Spiroplasma endosymbiont of Aspidapion aeneum]|uniref:hypothetical protein n=1 Tax=Spiroplasma endosymbiont of Aspidapion aeneum TaxID=3066276 RepID=UPI00313CD74D
MEKINKILIVILAFSCIIIFSITSCLYIVNVINKYLLIGCLFGILASWIYALIHLYSTKLIFKTENPFLQIGFAVLKTGVLFFFIIIIFFVFHEDNVIYGELIGMATIVVFLISSSTFALTKKG